MAYVNYNEQTSCYSGSACRTISTGVIWPPCPAVRVVSSFEPMSLAKRLRKFRDSQELSLDEVATRAKISKTYLWELEKDTSGERKPSAEILLRIANVLSVTIADLLDLP